ncbi:MAG TPA: hypothetical protein VL125_14735 [Pelobium sp.]|nr:hypothetical protein [Pelobium sp.]
MFGNKRHYSFKGGNNNKEKRLFWILAIIVSLIFMIIARYI